MMEYCYPNFGGIEGYKRILRLWQIRAIRDLVGFHMVSNKYTGICQRFVKELKGNYVLCFQRKKGSKSSDR